MGNSTVIMTLSRFLLSITTKNVTTNTNTTISTNNDNNTNKNIDIINKIINILYTFSLHKEVRSSSSGVGDKNLIHSGIVQALCSVIPLIDDNDEYNISDDTTTKNNNSTN